MPVGAHSTSVLVVEGAGHPPALERLLQASDLGAQTTVVDSLAAAVEQLRSRAFHVAMVEVARRGPDALDELRRASERLARRDPSMGLVAVVELSGGLDAAEVVDAGFDEVVGAPLPETDVVARAVRAAMRRAASA